MKTLSIAIICLTKLVFLCVLDNYVAGESKEKFDKVMKFGHCNDIIDPVNDEQLFLSGCGIDNFNPNDTFAEVNTLYLANNALRQIPHAIRDMPKLHTLFVGGNPIVSISKNIRDTRLGSLYLSQCELIKFEGSFPNLYDLYLEHNYLTAIPRAIFDIKHLDTLYMRGNPIRNYILTQSQIQFLRKIRHLALDPPKEYSCRNGKAENLTVEDSPFSKKRQIPVCTISNDQPNLRNFRSSIEERETSLASTFLLTIGIFSVIVLISLLLRLQRIQFRSWLGDFKLK